MEREQDVDRLATVVYVQTMPITVVMQTTYAPSIATQTWELVVVPNVSVVWQQHVTTMYAIPTAY